MASNIGIKIANGEFYPIMEENSSIRKRLILTTVHDNQPSVQIDLFRSATGVMADAQYIGSLVVENIKSKAKGEPSIEMVMSSNTRGEIVADAIDMDTSSSGEHHVLTVSLKSLDETSREVDIPDFELESNEEPPTGLYQRAKKIRNEKKGSSKVWIFILIGILLLLGLLAAWLFFLGGLEVAKPVADNLTSTVSSWLEPKPAKPSEPARQPEPAPVAVTPSEPARQPEPAPMAVTPSEPARQPEPVPVAAAPTAPARQPEPAPVIQAPTAAPAPRQETTRRRPPAPVASYNVPATIPREGVNYRIRWGDTLWDISEAFYRNPWLYTRIARYNNIRNPNLIISGRTIRIPPRN